jgi:hypothetical protein
MLDDLRNSASTFVEEEQSPNSSGLNPEPIRKEPFLGMTAAQRFVVALMLFLMTWVVGLLLLVVMEKMFISIPGLF